jgi:hypothetical protein
MQGATFRPTFDSEKLSSIFGLQAVLESERGSEREREVSIEHAVQG